MSEHQRSVTWRMAELRRIDRERAQAREAAESRKPAQRPMGSFWTVETTVWRDEDGVAESVPGDRSPQLDAYAALYRFRNP